MFEASHESTAPAHTDDASGFTATARFHHPFHVVSMSGELDLTTREAALQACASIGHVDVVVDMANLVFMDCAGYGALVASGRELERRGGSLVLMDAVGAPLRLLTLLDHLPHEAGSMLRSCRSSAPAAAATS